MAFCTNCGKPLDEGTVFCTNCGAFINPITYRKIPASLEKLFRMEKNQAICWGIIAILQILLAITTDDSIAYLLIGIYNGYAAYDAYKFAFKIKNNPPHNLIQQYERQLISIILFALIFLFLSPVSLIGLFFEFRIRDHVLTHRNEIASYINVN